MQAKYILIVEDEPALANIIRDYVLDAGMQARVVRGNEDPKAIALSTKPDLIVLDIMLPGKDGLTICREIRAESKVPIIFETAKVEEIDRLIGLELGADDYICKPFSPRELVARIKAVLRRAENINDSGSNSGNGAVRDQRLTLNMDAWSAFVDEEPLDLTRREFELMSIMYKRPGRVFSRLQLLEMAFPKDSDVFDRTIDSHIKNIRTKIKKCAAGFYPIRSVYGVGYAFEEE